MARGCYGELDLKPGKANSDHIRSLMSGVFLLVNTDSYISDSQSASQSISQLASQSVSQ